VLLLLLLLTSKGILSCDLCLVSLCSSHSRWWLWCLLLFDEGERPLLTVARVTSMVWAGLGRHMNTTHRRSSHLWWCLLVVYALVWVRIVRLSKLVRWWLLVQLLLLAVEFVRVRLGIHAANRRCAAH